MSSNVRKWDTADEIMYLDQIGQCYAGTQNISPAIMLKAYLQAADKRVNWGAIIPMRVIAHAKKLLRSAAR